MAVPGAQFQNRPQGQRKPQRGGPGRQASKDRQSPLETKSQGNDPWKSASESKGDLTDKIGEAIENAHQTKGLLKIGIGVFSSALFLNTGFWIGVCSGANTWSVLGALLSQNYALLLPTLAGIGVSWGSTYFQGYPIVAGGGKSMFSELIASVMRPQVAHIPSKRVDASRAEDYEQKFARFNSKMKFWWMVATAGEFAAGIIFMGAIFGGGLQSLFALIGFAYSIVGCQMGLAMIIQAREVMLTPAGRDVLKKLEHKAQREILDRV
jgi:hypothetical protein